MKEDSFEQWLGRQEELEGEHQLELAREAANAAGVDVEATVKSAKETWRLISTPAPQSPILKSNPDVVARFAAEMGHLRRKALESGVRNERDWIIDYLRRATENA